LEKMMKSKLVVLFLASTFAASSAGLAVDQKTTTTTQDHMAAMRKEAKISESKARKIALKRVPGTIEAGELEREHGKLLYSFDIKTSKPGVMEVQVSAIDGKILSVIHETPKDEAAEKKKEAQEHQAAPKH
jgi:uncharacterized membrane protein YkoI